VVIDCPYSARVLERIAKEGDTVETGSVLLILERLDEPLLTRLYLPVGVGYQIKSGMKVQVWPTHVNPSEFGYMFGQVRAAAKFPITPAEMLRRVENEDLVRELTATGPCLQVLVELTRDKWSADGYRWSSSKGPSVNLYHGMPCQARIIVGQRRPIQLLFPSLGGT
jgi:HlyD family secretion protein